MYTIVIYLCLLNLTIPKRSYIPMLTEVIAPAKAQSGPYKHDQGVFQKHLLKAILFQWPFKIL